MIKIIKKYVKNSVKIHVFLEQIETKLHWSLQLLGDPSQY